MSPAPPLTIPQALDLALEHHRAGRLAEAEALYRQILAVQPDHANALHLLGTIAFDCGQHDLAAEWIQRSLRIDPYLAPAHFNLGNLLKTRGRRQEAIAAYRRALELQPDFAEAHHNLGIACQEEGQLDEAITAFRHVLKLKPDFAAGQHNLAMVLQERGRFEEAVAAYQQTLRLNPNFAAAHYNLGNLWKEQNRWDEAIAAYRRALELEPDFAEALNNLAVGLMDRGQLEEAITLFQRVVVLKPGHAEGYNNLGMALKDCGLLDEALAAGRRAVEVQPDRAGAHNNLANVFKEQGQLDEAIAAYRRSLQLAPGKSDVHSNLICALHFHPAWDHTMIAAEQRNWNRQFAEPLKHLALSTANNRDPERRLRIGYVSADFRTQAAGLNLRPLFQNHNHRDFEILCYSGVKRADQLTDEFRQHADGWRSSLHIDDEALAAMIRKDGVDILVDLSQHTLGNRLPMFARQPAPVQVSFAGYPESTGVEQIGWRISDRWLEGWGMPNDECRMTEAEAERVFLIDSFWCYDPCGMNVGVNELPAKEKGGVTFGCLNTFCKVNEPLRRLWARVLREATHASLLILAGIGSHRQRILEFFEKEQIASNRIEFCAPCPRQAYFELYHRLDAALDTFPYNGHTTSLDALWMGVPVVSLAGQTRVSRGGLSILSNLGLPELVAHSPDEYVEIAVQLARDLSRLAELRQTLRARMEASVLMDAPRFARNIEAAYRAMWRQWCAQIAHP